MTEEVKRMPFIRLVATALGSLLLVGGLAAPASAEDSFKSEVLNALSKAHANNTFADETLLSNLRKLDWSALNKDYSSLEGATSTLSVPGSAAKPIEISTGEGQTISIALPFAANSKTAQRVADGAVAFDNQNDSATAILNKGNSSLQIVSVIKSDSAPERFTYQINVPSGFYLKTNGDKSASLFSAAGDFVGGIAPAWATDARGKAVPTHYEMAGTSFTQVVEHRKSNYAYPIVADPWLGFSLIDHTSWANTNPYSPTLSVFPTSWGRTVAFSTTYPFGGLILGSLDMLSADAAWSETLAKTSLAGRPNPDTPSMFMQFECHFFYVSKIDQNKVSWNLDTKRPYAPLAGQISTKCNPR
jgi:Protein of unknown function (DUF2599)